ncbi:hypothetical protein D3C81_785270 [compost metagenome]
MLLQKAATVFHEVIQKVGDHIPHANSVHPNTMFDRFQRLGARQLRQRALGRGIGRDTGEGEVGRVGSNVHDRAALVLHHLLHCFSGVEERTRHVGLHLPFPIFAGHLDQGLVQDATGVIDQDVQLAELLDRQGHCLLGRAVHSDVSDEGNQARTLKHVDRRVDVLGDDFRTASVKELGDRLTDAAGRAGHQHYFACHFVWGWGEVSHFMSPSQELVVVFDGANFSLFNVQLLGDLALPIGVLLLSFLLPPGADVY